MYPELPYGGPPDEWLAWANELPLAISLGAQCVRIGTGFADFEITQSPIELNPTGHVHGGIVAAAVDHAMGVIMSTVLPTGGNAVTTTLNIEYHRPALLPLRLHAELTRHGRSIAFTDVAVVDRNGDTCARGTGSMLPRLRLENIASHTAHAGSSR